MRQYRALRAAYDTAWTSAGLDSLAVRSSKPSGEGVVITQTNQESLLHDRMAVIFFGTDAADETLDFQFIGWMPDPSAGLWIPFNLLSGSATLGTMTGVAGQPVTDNDLIADTIAVTSGLADDADHRQVYSPTGNLAAMLEVSVFAFPRITIDLATGGVSASVNALYGFNSQSQRPG